jgi:hypothetical protein
MLIGHVSDERYVALADVALLLEGETTCVAARSLADGSIHADVPPGSYRVTLNRDGFGAKRVPIAVEPGKPYAFRLLSHKLLGYAWPKWVKSGELSEFRVHATEPYKLSLWRYGWRKELVRPIGWFDEHGPGATVQITPDGDFTQRGVAWNTIGYNNPHHRQFVEAPPRSGLYYFHAKSESGRFFSFPWIVAPARPLAPIAVLASNITWNAYNNFGGRSNYIHPEALPSAPTVNARQELRRYTDTEYLNYVTQDYAPLSFDRPEPINAIPEDAEIAGPIEGRAACHLAPAEWRLLGWMERQGFAYDLYAETQFHFDELKLDDYKILMVSTHPEYWSSDMYYRLKAWVFERGGRLVYLGGNGLNCDVEFLDGQTCIYRNEDDRQLRDKSRGFESRFHQRHESEASLLGVVYDDRGIMTAAPYRVIDADHWVFAGTGLQKGDRFGVHCQHQRVPGGASGHETDKVSRSSPPGTCLLAKGENPGDGGAEMVIHEPGGGAAVFSVGSICWPSSLLVDEHVSAITANVLRRFLEEQEKH